MTLVRKKIVREDKVVDRTPGVGNLVRVLKPDSVSLVGLPANQTGFKVVREDSTKPPAKETPMSKTIVRRTRRADTASPILSLAFPEGTTEADVTEALESYGMAGYKITQEAGIYMAIRADLQSISKEGTVGIRLNEAGVVATVQRAEGFTPTATSDKSGVVLAAYEFDLTKFDQTQIADWLQRNDVDSQQAKTENSENTCVVRRSDVTENEETRRLQLEDGVTAVLIRADAYDIPEGFYAVVNECAYGSWGWGHLDFAATMADVEFSEQVRNGVEQLDSVLRNILYYSSLPLDVRKTLMANALMQFGAYVEAIMESLPRQLLVSVVRSAQPQLEKDMATANQGGANPSAPETNPAAVTALTREDLTAAVADAVKPLAERLEKIERAGKPEPVTEPAPKESETLTRADLVSAMTDVVKPLAERLDTLEGTTVVRASGGDAVVQRKDPAEDQASLDAKKKDGTIFRGAFGNLTGRRTA